MSFLIDGPWLYANGRATPAPATRRPPLAAGTLAGLLGGERPALPRPPLDAPDLARPAARAAGATGCSTPASCRSTPSAPARATHAISAALFATYPLWLWLGVRHGER